MAVSDGRSGRHFSYGSPGLGNVGSYQASTRPFLSSSIEVSASGFPVYKFEFPSVTKFVTVKNTSPATDPATLRVGFSENGVNGLENNNWFLLEDDESFSADWRVSAVYLRVHTGAVNVTASVIAGMTGIDANDLAGNWSGSAGVG
mgnify:CR=1 FL=1